MLGSAKMNGCEECEHLKRWKPCFEREAHCEFCHLGECEDHQDGLAYVQALSVYVCRDCADGIMDELRKYIWKTYP